MMTLLLLVLYVSSVAVADNAFGYQNYHPEEENPHRIEYLPYMDKEGNIKYEYLGGSTLGEKAELTDVTLYLYTRRNIDTPEPHRLPDTTSLQDSEFYTKSAPNYFIVHGQSGNYSTELNNLIKTEILDLVDINVFVVDWSGPASKFYTEARQAVPYIGQFVGEYVNRMITDFGIEASSFRLVGHGLGAHICGEIGENIASGSVDYIVGLDPAGPLFSLTEPGQRLDKTDADYVHVIHTNAELLGFKSALGHADFYPNGGESQPGCGVDLIGVCSQDRAYIYYVESLKTSGFGAYLCSSWEEFEIGFCFGNDKTRMGEFELDKAQHGDFYLRTSDSEPYALGYYSPRVFPFRT